MSLSAQEIADLTKRCTDAKLYGRKIAWAEHFARELGYKDEAPPAKVAKFSAAHLLHLLGGAGAAQTSASPTKAMKTPKAEKKAAAVVAPPAPPPPPPPPPPPAPEPKKDEALEEALRALDDIAPHQGGDS